MIDRFKSMDEDLIAIVRCVANALTNILLLIKELVELYVSVTDLSSRITRGQLKDTELRKCQASRPMCHFIDRESRTCHFLMSSLARKQTRVKTGSSGKHTEWQGSLSSRVGFIAQYHIRIRPLLSQAHPCSNKRVSHPSPRRSCIHLAAASTLPLLVQSLSAEDNQASSHELRGSLVPLIRVSGRHGVWLPHALCQESNTFIRSGLKAQPTQWHTWTGIRQEIF